VLPKPAPPSLAPEKAELFSPTWLFVELPKRELEKLPEARCEEENPELPIREVPKRELSMCEAARPGEIAELDPLAAEFTEPRLLTMPEDGPAGFALVAKVL